MTDLDAPVALVTAASRGMGEAIARRLHGDGYRLALLSRGAGVEALASELGAVGVRGSVTSAADLERLVAAAVGRWDRIDAVVNNTGHAPGGDLLEIADDAWHEGLDLVFLNVVRMARLATPHMTARRGSIVNITTFGAAQPSLEYPVSSALRTAVGAFTRLYAERYGKLGLRMNSVLPGFIDSQDFPDAAGERPALGRLGRTTEVADVVGWLVSDQASYVTGQSILVDGGLVRSL